MSSIKGIPTLCHGIRMRSRLEATWGFFFRELGWSYEYEPYDMDGWIPDFLLKTHSRKYLVEIKPATDCIEFKKFWPKIEYSKPDLPVLLLGIHVFKEQYDSIPKLMVIGQIRERYRTPRGKIGRVIADCGIGLCRDCQKIGFTGVDDLDGKFPSSCCNQKAQGSHKGISTDGEANSIIIEAWSKSKNLAQWSPSK